MTLRTGHDTDDEDTVMVPGISMDDDDSSLKQIFVVSDEADIPSYDEVRRVWFEQISAQSSLLQFEHLFISCFAEL